MNWIKVLKKEQKGQSIVEFSMMLPVFLLIMFFAIELSFGVYYKMVLNQLILDVARVVSVSKNETTTQLNNKVQAVLSAYQNKSAIVFQTRNTSLFTFSWTIETVDVIYKVIVVKARYTGIKLPFIGTLPVSDQIIYPYIDHGIGI
jgi:Flp pilus assembly protein TadG